MSSALRAILLFSVFLAAASESRGADCTGSWERFSSAPYQGFLFPDLSANYWRFRFKIPVDGRTALRVNGRYAHARYMNFNIYDQATMDSNGSLPDREILPDAKSANPFWNGVPRNTPIRDYSVWVVPYGLAAASANRIVMPKPAAGAETQGIELWYRVYVSDPGKDIFGGTGLPTITAIDLQTGKETACPERQTSFPPLATLIKNSPPRPTDERLEFYASKAISVYQNPDNRYVVGHFNFDAGEVAVVRLKAPGFFENSNPTGLFEAHTDVRFWSLCIVGLSTLTSDCARDSELVVARDGFVTVVIGPEAIAADVRAHKLNFLPRGHFLKPVLIYRNLLTGSGYPGDIAKVPTWPQPPEAPLHTAEHLAAWNFIGDYAPRGRHCDQEDFTAALSAGTETLCGMKVSYP